HQGWQATPPLAPSRPRASAAVHPGRPGSALPDQVPCGRIRGRETRAAKMTREITGADEHDRFTLHRKNLAHPSHGVDFIFRCSCGPPEIACSPACALGELMWASRLGLA